MGRGRLRGIRICPPRPSSADHGTLAQCVPHTGSRTGLKEGGGKHTTHPLLGQEGTHTFKWYSPVPSVSHVSMTASGMGSPLVVSTRPSTYI